MEKELFFTKIKKYINKSNPDSIKLFIIINQINNINIIWKKV
jgi:hypothetical protein